MDDRCQGICKETGKRCQIRALFKGYCSKHLDEVEFELEEEKEAW